MEWITRLMLPPQGSAYAGEVDTVYMALFWLSVFLFLGIVIPAFYFAWRYRYKAWARDSARQTHNTTLEIVWTVLPLLLCVGIFFWGLKGWMEYAVAPGDAMEIQITARRVELGVRVSGRLARRRATLHVPVNKPVRLIMTSEDVIHDFFVPTCASSMTSFPDAIPRTGSLRRCSGPPISPAPNTAARATPICTRT